MKRLLLAITVLFSAAFSNAQMLPVGWAPGEKEQMPFYLDQFDEKAPGFTAAPAGKLRNMGQWEEIEGLVITWTSFPGIHREIIKYAQTECKVYIVCSDSNAVRNSLINNNIPITTNIKYVVTPFNSIWARDYSANPVYINDVDSLIYVDWVYNRPRPKDDTTCRAIAAKAGMALFQTSAEPNKLIHTGGNYMSDGLGTAFSSELILDENPTKTEAQIDTIMKKYMGINRYIKMETLPYDGIHHIDMHMKLLDEQTLLVGEYAQGEADGPQIEANINYVMSNFNSYFGTPYKLVRIPQPPDNGGDYPDNNGDYYTYTNAVFVNKTLLLPIYGNAYDTTAIRILKENLPGYRVIGIPCTDIIQQSGAIHCITNSFGVKEPLLIVHQKLEDTYNYQTPYVVNARMQHKSGIQSGRVYWTTDTTQAWQSAVMTNTDVLNNIWSANIPAQLPTTRIFYYIEGQANSGKMQVRPITAPTGFWNFKILGDPIDTTTSIKPMVIDAQAMQPYPNPANAITCIPVYAKGSTNAHIYITDILGQKVADLHNGDIPAGTSNYFINAATLSQGMYLVTVETPRTRNTVKLMVR
ncbi:MAG: agmatine deiminase family protein [Sphingobacteriales bacterium JAD_PAG50586_3]|nr:MAG: agmatine deiminase family protein [Sphingobacteriales bacterium JAD_PAG50586_3]